MPEYPTPVNPAESSAVFHPPVPAQIRRPGRLDPFETPCPCMTSYVMPGNGWVHCPSCHTTYEPRRSTAPVLCRACDFNLRDWRKRNGIDSTTQPEVRNAR